ncbi:tyrosine-type recombinase/integrase [Alcaligenaceae bacterium]|nr:tyrosine-type recombinase/integrase [Alcaligenaceae bacterium]
MPVTTLSQKMLKTLACPQGQGKIDYHDASCKGLMIEVRATGGRTWYLRYRDARGKQRQFRMADAQDLSLDQARKRADELRGQVALGNDPAEQKAILRQVPTFAQFVDERYLPFIKGYKRSWDTDVSLLNNHLIPRFGKRHMDEISKQDIIAMHHGRRAQGAAPGSANRLLILMRYIFNLALKWEVAGLIKNPTAGVPLFEENNKKERYITQEEAARLYAALQQSESEMLQHIVPMLILTGARKREVLDARWSDFDLPKRLWRIAISKSGKARHVPLSEGVIKLLEQVPRFDDCVWVFPNPKTRAPFVTIFRSWDTTRIRAGLPEVRIHDLRHSFASFLINNGRSLYEVQKILGHTQVRTTQRYAHLSQETLLDAVNTAVNALGDAFMPKALSVAPASVPALGVGP